jgi:hypothetical protein
MGYRQLTPDEIIQLGQELENYQQWENVCRFVAMLYPPEAHQIAISVTSEYNDNTYDDDAHIIVADRAGEILPFDFERPWWIQFTFSEEEMQSMREDKSGNLSNIGGPTEEALRALCTDLLGIEFLNTWQPHDPITYTYLVDTPPTISYQQVYISE